MMVALVCMCVEGAGDCWGAVMVARFAVVLLAHFNYLNFLMDGSHHILNGPFCITVVTCRLVSTGSLLRIDEVSSIP